MNRPEDRDLRGGYPTQDITDAATGGSRLLSERCSTCILRAGDLMYLGPERLRAVIGDALAAGTFVVCHDTLTYGDFPDYGPAICRGFFDAYTNPRELHQTGEKPQVSRSQDCRNSVPSVLMPAL